MNNMCNIIITVTQNTCMHLGKKDAFKLGGWKEGKHDGLENKILNVGNPSVICNILKIMNAEGSWKFVRNVNLLFPFPVSIQKHLTVMSAWWTETLRFQRERSWSLASTPVGTPTSHISGPGFESPSCFWFQLPAKAHPGGEQVRAQVVWSPPPVWETWSS